MIWLSGCGGKPLPKTVPVKGKVLLPDGSTLTMGKVNFAPVGTGDDKRSATGVIRKDGTFEMQTYSPGDGARPGDYTVFIEYPRLEDDFDYEKYQQERPAAENPVPEKYRMPGPNNDLKHTVTEKKGDPVEFKLKP
jgi:hypothetical protein